MSIVVTSNQPTEPTKAPEVKSDEPKSAPAASDAEQKEQNPESPESDTEETENEASESLEASESDEDAGEPKETEQDKPKKKSGWQKRIDKLHSRITAASQEAEYWKKVALQKQEDPSKSSKSDEPKATKAADVSKPNPDDFESHAEYVEAVADWKAEQKLRARDEAAEKAKLQSEFEQTQKAHIQRVKSFAEKVEDFSDVLAEVDDIRLSPTLEHELISSENGPELMYELAKDRKELERINALHPLKIARELGKVEARIAARSSEAQKPEPKKLTQAPKPIAPVGGTKGAVGKSIDDPNISQREYEAIRRKQIAARSTW